MIRNINKKRVAITLLMKFMKLYYLKENNCTNVYDFEYEEKILFQLELICLILEESISENIILLNVDVLTDKMIKKLRELNCKYIIVFTRKSCILSNYNEMYLISKGYFDFANMNELYDKVCVESGVLWSEEELKLNIINYFNEIDCTETRFIDQQLNYR